MLWIDNSANNARFGEYVETAHRLDSSLQGGICSGSVTAHRDRDTAGGVARSRRQHTVHGVVTSALRHLRHEAIYSTMPTDKLRFGIGTLVVRLAGSFFLSASKKFLALTNFDLYCICSVSYSPTFRGRHIPDMSGEPACYSTSTTCFHSYWTMGSWSVQRLWMVTSARLVPHGEIATFA